MQEGKEKFLTVVTGTCAWAVPLSAVVNIITKGLHAPVPLLPPWHLGVFYYEGAVLPFYDLGQYTGGAARSWKLVLICKLEAELIALAAEGVGETIFVEAKDYSRVRNQWQHEEVRIIKESGEFLRPTLELFAR